MNYYNLEKTYKICVKECPSRKLTSLNDVYQYYTDTNTTLCDYSVDVKDYTSQTKCELSLTGCYGPCPAFDVPVE